MRIAVVDLGTNTFHLLVADVMDGSRHSLVRALRIPVKLGEAGITKKFIAPAAYQRGIDAAHSFKLIINELKADIIFCFGTSAMRSATNGQQMANDLAEILETRVEIISGDQEAMYIYQGVKEGVTLESQHALIMDIGGGSIEFIIANEQGPAWLASYDLGAARLLEMFSPSDPISAAEIEILTHHLEQQLEPLIENSLKYGVTKMIGSSGSFETMAAMICEQYNLSCKGDKTEIEISLSHFEEIYHQITNSTREERMLMPGMALMRIDMIVIGVIIIRTVIRMLGISHIRLSEYALKEGILFQLVRQHSNSAQ